MIAYFWKGLFTSVIMPVKSNDWFQYGMEHWDEIILKS